MEDTNKYASLNKQSQRLKAQAGQKFQDKLDALEKAIERRLKLPTCGLPTSISAFLRWEGEDGNLPNIYSSRSTLSEECHVDLKESIINTLDIVKAPLACNGSELEKLKRHNDEQRLQLIGLSAANQRLEVEIESLKEDMLVLTTERNRYKKNFDQAVKRADSQSPKNVVKIK